MKQSSSSFRIASLAMLCNSDFLIAFHRLCFKAFGLVVAMNFVWYEFYDHYGYHCQGSVCLCNSASSKVDKLSNMADTEEIVAITEPSRPPTAGSIKETSGETSSRPSSSGEHNALR